MDTTATEHPVPVHPATEEYASTDNLENLLEVLPQRIVDEVRSVVRLHSRGTLIEIIMDLGRPAEARFIDAEYRLGEQEVTREELAYVADRIGNFGDDNRAGIERTLHRISAIRNRSGEIVGLTCRIGRAVFGTIAIIRDLVESGDSILLVGKPGVGKTTLLREVARVLSDDLGKRVVVVDTSNEIAGDGDIPHPAIGRSRRMQVATPTAQHAVMIEAVENHMPEVIVIDEIGTELEAMAARTIAERGVQLIGTAHGNTLENLLMNPTLSDLIGGIQSVTLSDEEARRRGTQKSILERKAPPTFGIMVELLGRDTVAVHHDVAATVDALLRGLSVDPEVRTRSSDGTVEIQRGTDLPPAFGVTGESRNEKVATGASPTEWQHTSQREENVRRDAGKPAGTSTISDTAVVPWNSLHGRGVPGKPIRVYPFGVSRNRLEQTIRNLGIIATITKDVREADLVVTLKNYYRSKPPAVKEAEFRGIPVYVLRSNTIAQMQSALSPLSPALQVEEERQSDRNPKGRNNVKRSGDNRFVEAALEEAEDAIGAIMQGLPNISLAPQPKPVRRLQHELADRYNVDSRSKGKEPNRRVEIFRGRSA